MVAKQGDTFPDNELREYVDKELEQRGINEQSVGEVVYGLQHKYYPNKTVADFGSQLSQVLKKREVLSILAVGFMIDDLATDKKLPPIMQHIIETDQAMFSTDELLAVSLVQLYGGIAIASWGGQDVHKTGLAKEMDYEVNKVRTMSDDLFEALCSACAARIGQESVII